MSWLAADGTDEEQTDGKIAPEACRLLLAHKDQPFFLGVGFFRPHTPYVSPKKYFSLYAPEQIALAQNPPGDREGKPAAALTVFPPHYGMDEGLQRTVTHAYYASVSFMDTQFGVVLDELDRLGLTDRTVVVFLSDHGYHLGEHRGEHRKMRPAMTRDLPPGPYGSLRPDEPCVNRRAQVGVSIAGGAWC